MYQSAQKEVDEAVNELEKIGLSRGRTRWLIRNFPLLMLAELRMAQLHIRRDFMMELK